MQNLFVGSALLIGILLLAEIVTRLMVHFANRQDANRTREFRRVVMLAEAEAIAASHLNRTQRNHRQQSRDWGR